MLAMYVHSYICSKYKQDVICIHTYVLSYIRNVAMVYENTDKFYYNYMYVGMYYT